MSLVAGTGAAVNSMLPSQAPPVAQVASRLMGKVAHDLRTPIMVIRGYLKMILDGRTGQISEEQRECLRVALESVQRLTDIAAVSARGSEVLPRIQASHVDIREIWQKVRSTVQPEASEKGVSFKENFAATSLMVCGDVQMLEGVLQVIVGRVVALMGRDKELTAEIVTHHSGDVVLTLLAGCDSKTPEAVRLVSDLQTEVFLIGGKLSLDTTVESGLTFRLSLPGSDA
jgi:signal transduction histidine kinase